jgi:hypothetical protein
LVAVWQEGKKLMQKLALLESDGMGFFKQLKERLDDDDFIFALTVARCL